jgi:hypothetical protein
MLVWHLPAWLRLEWRFLFPRSPAWSRKCTGCARPCAEHVPGSVVSTRNGSKYRSMCTAGRSAAQNHILDIYRWVLLPLVIPRRIVRSGTRCECLASVVDADRTYLFGPAFPPTAFAALRRRPGSRAADTSGLTHILPNRLKTLPNPTTPERLPT